MIPDYLSFAIRILILLFAGLISELSFSKKNYALAIFVLSVWITTFRLAFLRAVASYIGVFRYDQSDFTQNIAGLLRDSNLTNITDIVMLIGIVILFIDVSGKFSSVKRTKGNGHKTGLNIG